MSELLHSGQHPGASGHHPDAGQLSAFLERALPVHEREQVLAHLAVCPDCRETVALSLPAEAPQALEPAPMRRPWLRGWVIFAPAALALAASVFFAVFVHRANTGSSIATPPAQLAVSQPPAPIPPQAQASVTATAPHPVRSLSANRLTSADRATSVVPPSVAPGPAAPRQMDALAPPPPAPPPPSEGVTATGSAMAIMAPETKAAGAPLGSATQTVAVTRAAPLMNIPSDSLDLRLAQPAAHAVLFKRPLPSGLAALSSAQNGRAILAIDAHNSVFRSNDFGRHWTAVPTPWKGRAVKVDLVSYSTRSAGVLGALHGEGTAIFANALRQPSPLPLNASLTGVVKDASGAVFPGAAVTIVNSATNAERKVTTDASGRYLADNLAPGSYSIEAHAPGFMAEHTAGVMVDASKQAVANLTLQVGSAAETVTVAAPSPQLSDITTTNKKTAMAPAAIPPPAVFAITTDTGERWTSTDGVNWTRQ